MENFSLVHRQGEKNKNLRACSYKALKCYDFRPFKFPMKEPLKY